MSLDIIFAEFGSRDKANQKWENPIGRLDPTYQSVKAYFPDANIICYSDDESIGDGYDVEVRHIDSDSTPFDKNYKEGKISHKDYMHKKRQMRRGLKKAGL